LAASFYLFIYLSMNKHKISQTNRPRSSTLVTQNKKSLGPEATGVFIKKLRFCFISLDFFILKLLKVFVLYFDSILYFFYTFRDFAKEKMKKQQGF